LKNIGQKGFESEEGKDRLEAGICFRWMWMDDGYSCMMVYMGLGRGSLGKVEGLNGEWVV
jgi:hypothetical protein